MATLDPKTNRLSYGDLLSPEPEFTLRKAVATTYSLDIQTLVASSIALGLGEATDSELARNPINLLYALQKVTDKMIIFCDSSQIKNVSDKKKKNKFLTLLEKTIVPVSLSGNGMSGNYPSFHPKCWILQYESLRDKNLRKYKFVVLSRNLTFDRSWDVSVCLDGLQSAENAVNPQTQRIIDFVDFLENQIDDRDPYINNKTIFLSELKSDLQKVVFVTEDSKFNDFEVLPIGTGALDVNKDELFKSNDIEDIVVMSPFVSKSIVKSLLDRELPNDYFPTLITRRSELSKIVDLKNLFSVHCLKDNIVDGEEIAQEQDGQEYMKQDIHAKIYAAQYPNGNRFYIGSMNASENGANRNIELLLKLYSDTYRPDDFVNDINLFGEKSMFEELDLNNIELVEPNPEEDFGRYVKNICRMGLSANVVENSGGLFDVTISIDNFEEVDCKVSIKPFFVEDPKMIAKEIFFNNLNLDQLSEFYTITIEDQLENTIIIPTSGIPEGRDRNIIKSIISSKKKLSEYIAFILGDDAFATFADDIMDFMDGDFDEDEKRRHDTSDAILTPVYERMLKTAYTDPERLRDVEDVINMIDDEEIVTPEFKQMYETFKTTLNL